MNRDVCGVCWSDVCECELPPEWLHAMKQTGAALSKLVDMVCASAPRPHVAAMLLWLLTRDEERCSRKDALLATGLHFTTFDALLADLEGRDFARVVPGKDRRRRCIAPTVRLLGMASACWRNDVVTVLRDDKGALWTC